MDPSQNADAANGLTPIVMQTDWFPQAEHGGFYQALARGFYREVGLDVDVRPGGPSSHVRLRVARGDADFGLLRSDDTAMAVSQGLPLVMVAASMQHDGEALLVHADSPVHDFADLDGQTLMAPLSMVWVSYIQKKYDVAFNLVPTSYGLASFFADPGLVRSCYLTSEPFLAQERGVPVRALPLIDADYDAYAGIVVRRDLTRNSPEVVRAFVAATLRGWDDYLNGDPTPANTLILERNSQMTQGQLDYSRAHRRNRPWAHPTRNRPTARVRRTCQTACCGGHCDTRISARSVTVPFTLPQLRALHGLYHAYGMGRLKCSLFNFTAQLFNPL